MLLLRFLSDVLVQQNHEAQATTQQQRHQHNINGNNNSTNAPASVRPQSFSSLARALAAAVQ
eukprot:4291729-Pyramimonas_sp.AAC.1